MSSVHNFFEYKIARKMIADIPVIIKSIDNVSNALKPYSSYTSVRDLIWSINQTRVDLNRLYDYYINIYQSRSTIIIPGGTSETNRSSE
jgi:hypothetical protein